MNEVPDHAMEVKHGIHVEKYVPQVEALILH